ncbi:N-acetyltransferase [Flavobacterium sp. 9AF]|uniref:GNAT family N-acetyltransferase n=1 Tax=Flavobacterium sp. 9AF TaxID=2653142 RepID=UPI0012F23373|nr:GNAT family N-acetyltransferase [Flavobacterium sp. 9AF]VXA95833.1 N-acetyltransferase [Flavobacterium sp. 9AF]
MQVILRPYQIEDCRSILEIVNYNINYTTNIYEFSSRTLEEQIQQFEDKLKKRFPVIVAELNKEVVGFGYYSEFRTRPAYQFTVEHSVYVSNEYHNKGIGKIILTELIQLAKKQNKNTMIAVIDSENQNSISFHQKAGFKTVGIIEQSGYKFDRWLNSVIMQLLLNL